VPSETPGPQPGPDALAAGQSQQGLAVPDQIALDQAAQDGAAGRGRSAQPWAPPAGRMTPGRQYAAALVAGAAGAGLVVLALRERWARAVFIPPKPLSPQVINVTGGDLSPLASALALVALACLAAVIATRGIVRRAVGVLLAGLGAGTAAAAGASASAATVLSVAAGKTGSPGAAAISGTAGSTTAGGGAGGFTGAVGDLGAAGQAIMTGTPWRAAVLAGALVIVAAGIAVAWQGASWPVMSARYDRPGPGGPGQAGQRAAGPARDSATMWESLSAGGDPTDHR
jgi:uncharacterized membrane protein (TIGR02234 family)